VFAAPSDTPADISDKRTLRSTDQAVDNAAQLAKLLVE
jgi:hypothetical protein